MVRKFTSIIGLFLNDYGRKYYLGEMASLLKKPHQTIKPYAEELVKEGIVLKVERKNIVEYSLKFKDKRVYEYIIIAEKEKLLEKLKKEAILGVLYEKLSYFFDENIFVIFGSASEEVKKGSDIDLLIIGKKNVNKEIKQFEEVYNKKIHKVQVNDASELTLTLVKELYKKHLILNNTEKLVRFFGGLHEQNKLV